MTDHAVVVGGNRGIGRAVVERLLADGLSVTATGRDEAALSALSDDLRDAGTSIGTATLDVTDRGAFRRLAARLDPTDVLVVSAGISEAAPLARTDPADWDRQLAVNATGVFLALQAFVPSMVERGRGRVVVVTSTAALSGGPYISAYAASKHAAQGLVRSVAAEVAGSGVTVNAVCPHFVRTDMADRSIDRIRRATGRSAGEAEEALASSSRLGRLLEPEEVAGCVSFLVSADARAISGQALVLDGGGHW